MNATLRDVLFQYLVTIGTPPERARSDVNSLAAEKPLLSVDVSEQDPTQLALGYEVVDQWLRMRGSSFNELSAVLTPNADDGPTHEQFVSARAAVLEVLEQFGTSDPFGDGDFYLVEDRVSSHHLLLEVQNPGRLTQSAIAKLSELLTSRLRGWQLGIRGIAQEDVVLGDQWNSDGYPSIEKT